MYQKRTYRNLFKGENIHFFNVCIDQTDLMIGAHKILYKETVGLVKEYRRQIEEYIKLDPEFLNSLEPLNAKREAPLIIQKMCDASIKAGVGPMAAVAGAVSEMVGTNLLKYSDEVIVENGGDIFIKTKMKRKVGIFAGKSPLSQKLAFEISPDRTPLGVCTSSGTVGHSLSFGKADAVVILSNSTSLADAAATSVCNIVKSYSDIQKAVEFASSIQGVGGVVIIMGDKIAAWGDIKLVQF